MMRGGKLLDATYSAILESTIPKSGKALEQYCSVMHEVVVSLEPPSMAALNYICEQFPNKQDHYDIVLIL